ncbi:MAG TPA: LuxR family transcriptional regulator [Vineibacter sp.]|nr:LuxR family transcriptional regulator [Vineibacter sp.]
MRSDVAMRFIDDCARETDTSAAVDAFLTAIRAFGFEACAAGAWVGIGRRRSHRFYFNNWPRDWFEIYESKGLVHNDPVVFEARRRMTPFLWSEMTQTHSFKVLGADIVEEASRYGWREVMVVPLHGPAGYQGAVSLGALSPVTLSPVERSLLRAMALAVHDRCHETVGFGAGVPANVTLTRRESECMEWVAAGKSDSEIGQILGLAATTVHFHVERVKSKLDTNSRTHAVGLLVLAGIV